MRPAVVPTRRPLSVLFLAALLFPGLAPGNASAVGRTFVYLSPSPGARLVSPRTNLIARLAGVEASALLQTRFTVTGASSGAHQGRLHLSSDGRTLLFNPDDPFAPGEEVRVAVEAPAKLASERLLASYTFTVTPGGAPAFDPLRQAEVAAAPPRPSMPFATRHTLDLPEIDSSIYGTPSPGRLFLASLDFVNPSYLLIVDDYGNPVFSRSLGPSYFDFKLQPTGVLSYYESPPNQFVLMDSAYVVIDSIGCGNGYATDVHELRLLPNGHALLLGDDPEIVDMSAIVPGGDPNAVVIGIILQELDAERNVIFQWRSWDHYQITDATHEDLTAPSIDYVHANAIEVDADGNLLLSCRHMDEITKIDRNTGETIWRWGGKNNQFTPVGDTLGFSHQHAIRVLPNGDYTMFDNGNYHEPQFSRALEWQLDPNAMTATLKWQYRNSPDSYGGAMGYVQRLASGNTLIGWGIGKPDVIEVTPDGTKVMQMSFVDGQFSYRAYRTDWAPATAAVVSRHEPPNAPTLGGPNPARGAARLSAELPAASRVKLAVYDVTGRRVLTLLDGQPEAAGRLEWSIDLSYMPAGVYLCRLDADGQTVSRKLVVEK
ncbi:MAG TPA: aryl-sulfate sulfotransferase [Candidatus Acidoferrales bacterium]|nr:aryl-sulfate sulfotransferase [Candidatus Acidoferrales bacterium]